MDEKDLEHAEALTDMAREDGLWHIRKALEPEHDPDFVAPYCIDCGNEIPRQRLEMGRIRCIYCQRAKELRQKQGTC